MSLAVWRLEWRVAFARRRLLLWNVAVPLFLLLPVASSRAASMHKGAVLAVLVVLFGTFGSCIPLLREGELGWLDKVLRSGYGDRRWLAERLASGTAIDMLELTPAVAGFLIATGVSLADVGRLLPALLLALLVANILGVLTAAFVRSVAEGALVSAAAGLFALHFSGLFRPSEPGSWQMVVEVLDPLTTFTRSLAAGSATGGPPTDGAWGPPLAGSILVFGILLFGTKLTRRLRKKGQFDTDSGTSYILQPDHSQAGNRAFPNDI